MDAYRKEVSIRDEPSLLDIVDLSVQDQLRSPADMRGAAVCILKYTITDSGRSKGFLFISCYFNPTTKKEGRFTETVNSDKHYSNQSMSCSVATKNRNFAYSPPSHHS